MRTWPPCVRSARSQPGEPVLFIPPYEWYNRDQTKWCDEMGVTLINFTPGSGSNRDYAPEGDRTFVPSKKLRDDILAYEQKDPHGLNGFILLLHIGAQRQDLFHTQLGSLCDELTNRGYKFVRVDKLLGPLEQLSSKTATAPPRCRSRATHSRPLRKSAAPDSLPALRASPCSSPTRGPLSSTAAISSRPTPLPRYSGITARSCRFNSRRATNVDMP